MIQVTLKTPQGDSVILKDGQSPVGARVGDRQFDKAELMINGDFSNLEIHTLIKYLQDITCKITAGDRLMQMGPSLELKKIVDEQIEHLKTLKLEPKAIMFGSKLLAEQFKIELMGVISLHNDELDMQDIGITPESYKGLEITWTNMENVSFNMTPGLVSPVQITYKREEDDQR